VPSRRRPPAPRQLRTSLFGAGLRPRRARDRRSPPPAPQRTTDRFVHILCCIFDEHLVKPRSAIDSRPNPNLNTALRIAPISPSSGSFVHFPGFSSLLDSQFCHHPQVFSAPPPAVHNSQPRTPTAARTSPLYQIRSTKTSTQLHKSFQIQQIPPRYGRSEPQTPNNKTCNASAVFSSRSPGVSRLP